MLNSTLGLLSQASLPMGLIAVGSGLRLKGLHSQRGTLWYGVLAKLLLVPAIAWGLATLFGLSGVYFNIAVLMAALPVSTMAYVLATRMGGDGDTIAAQVMLSTLLAALTLAFVALTDGLVRQAISASPWCRRRRGGKARYASHLPLSVGARWQVRARCRR